jgi:dihydrofolate reductase
MLGGPRTVRAFQEIGGLDRLELLVLPVLLGDGLRLTDADTPRSALRLLRSDQTFPDGTTELVYALS